MKTKPIPAIVMLTAGFIACMTGIFQRMEFLSFAKMLLIVMICFYILGSIAAYILEKNFTAMKEKEAEEAEKEESEEDGEALENVESDEEQQ